jgi:hypothetical protein
MHAMRVAVLVTGLFFRNLRKGGVADLLVAGAIGSVISLILALIMGSRIDAAAFFLRSDFHERVRIPAESRTYPESVGQLRYFEIVGVRLQPVLEGFHGRNPSVNDVDTDKSETATLLIVPDDEGALRDYFGSNVPGTPWRGGALLDESTAQYMGVRPGQSVALIAPLSGIELPAISFKLSGLTKAYADPDDPLSVRGLIIVPQSLLSPEETSAIVGANPDFVSPYASILVRDKAPIDAPSGVSRLSLAWGALTGGPGAVETTLGSVGVGFFGALMWASIGFRSSSRSRRRSARTRGVVLALGLRPARAWVAISLLICIRIALSSLIAVGIVYLLFPVILGRPLQPWTLLVLVGYLIVMSTPELIWSATRMGRESERAISELFAEEE